MSYSATYTLSQLREFESNTASVTKQFPLNPARVKAIQKSYNDTGVFFGAFSVAESQGKLYLIGGRHRLAAFSQLDDPELSYPAFVQVLDGEAEILKAVEIDNGSRAMTPSEKDYLSFSYTVASEGEFSISSVSTLRLAYLEYEIDGKGTATTETIKKVWGGVLRKLTSAQKKVLVTNKEALDAVMTVFQNEFVHICSGLATPARQYQTVVTKVFPLLVKCLDGFEAVKKASARLSKKDKEDVLICGKALEAALEQDRNLVTATDSTISEALAKEAELFKRLANEPASAPTSEEDLF
jgi:hypothetical protein